MHRNRIMWGGGALALALLAISLGGCGGGGSSTTAGREVASTQSADAVVLDKVLSREEDAVEAYAAVIPGLPPRLARMASYFRAQEQEHVDGVIKAMRGLKDAPETTRETIEPGPLKSVRDRLVFLYEIEGATIDEELSAISHLEASWPRSLLASTVADQAQHLALLRRALGAGPLETVPVPFEDGTFPPPVG